MSMLKPAIILTLECAAREYEVRAMHPSHSSDPARVALHKLPYAALSSECIARRRVSPHLYARTCVIKEIHFSSFAAQSKCKSNKYSSVARRERAVINGEQRRFKIWK
jgi:hypothetical protein